MTKVWTPKNIIAGDGVDHTDVYIDGEAGEEVSYLINGEQFTAVLEDLGNSGRETLEITCDTPNTTIVVQCGESVVVIYAVEVPV